MGHWEELEVAQELNFLRREQEKELRRREEDELESERESCYSYRSDDSWNCHTPSLEEQIDQGLPFLTR